MRTLRAIVIHCSATVSGRRITVEDIRNWHTWPFCMSNGWIRYKGRYYNRIDQLPPRVQNHWGRGWLDIGYHFVVDPDGTVRPGRPIELPGAHVQGHNVDTIGMVYIGGLNIRGNPEDTRTDAQRKAIRMKCQELIAQYPSITDIKGHRDYSPDIDRDGVIESWEWIKVCPCFDVASEYRVEDLR